MRGDQSNPEGPLLQVDPSTDHRTANSGWCIPLGGGEELHRAQCHLLLDEEAGEVGGHAVGPDEAATHGGEVDGVERLKADGCVLLAHGDGQTVGRVGAPGDEALLEEAVSGPDGRRGEVVQVEPNLELGVGREAGVELCLAEPEGDAATADGEAVDGCDDRTVDKAGEGGCGRLDGRSGFWRLEEDRLLGVGRGGQGEEQCNHESGSIFRHFLHVSS